MDLQKEVVYVNAYGMSVLILVPKMVLNMYDMHNSNKHRDDDAKL
jgi:hypothetical protein